VGGLVRQRNKGKVSARYLRRDKLDSVGLPLSLKTVHCTVFAFGTLAFESLLALYTKNKNHPCGWFLFLSYPYKKDFFRRICVRDSNSRKKNKNL